MTETVTFANRVLTLQLDELIDTARERSPSACAPSTWVPDGRPITAAETTLLMTD